MRGPGMVQVNGKNAFLKSHIKSMSYKKAVQVVQVVQVKSNIMRMCAHTRARVFLLNLVLYK